LVGILLSRRGSLRSCLLTDDTDVLVFLVYLTMRILILDTYYQEPLDLIYEQNPGLEQRPYDEQIRSVYDFGFARADFLPLNLRRLGHEAEQFIANVEPLQRRWAIERGLRLPASSKHKQSALRALWKRGYTSLRWRMGIAHGPIVEKWETAAVAAQVAAYDPEVIFVCDVLHLPVKFLAQLKEDGRRILVGEIAYPIPANLDLRPFDLLVSAAPNYVERLRQSGANAEFLRLAFEPSILDRLDPSPKREGVVFVGYIGAFHQKRVQLLEEVAERVPLSCWGTGAETLDPNSPLRKLIQPPLWGYQMYRKLQEAQIVLNIHVDVSEKYAGNMRLYETTGVGTTLVTDWKSNLHELFEPGREVIAYHSPAECADLVEYYLARANEREAIGRAGQQRTLREHTYLQRMQEMGSILERHLRKPFGQWGAGDAQLKPSRVAP